MNSGSSVFDRICRLLDAIGVGYQVKEHSPTFTSRESATAREDALGIGGKALVFKTKTGFANMVVPADKKVDSRQLKKMLSTKSLRFATKEELLNLTGLEPGAVPPFGSPIFELKLFVAEEVYDNDLISFNAGDHTRSISMISADHLKVAKPIILTGITV